jgi:hypothetical protein
VERAELARSVGRTVERGMGKGEQKAEAGGGRQPSKLPCRLLRAPAACRCHRFPVPLSPVSPSLRMLSKQRREATMTRLSFPTVLLLLIDSDSKGPLGVQRWNMY